MEISDDEANMIAGRIFDAIESKGIFNRQLVATEIKAGLALVHRAHNKPMIYVGDGQETVFVNRPGRVVREFVNGLETVPHGYRPPSPSETERQIVKEIQELLGMPLSPGKRDPDGTAHYRLPDTRKAAKDLRRVRVSGVTYAVTPPYPMDDYAAQVEILRWLGAYGGPPDWATPI